MNEEFAKSRLSSGCTPSQYSQAHFIQANELSTSDSIPLDAIIIPTHSARSNLWQQLSSLAPFSRMVLVFPTGGASATIEMGDLPESVHWIDYIPIKRIQNEWLGQGSACNPSVNISRDYDLPLKRNIALQIARRQGFQRVLFLDDDITLTPQQLRQATCALNPNNPIVGFHVFEFPDISTVEHIETRLRETAPRTMPGGNCLFVMPEYIRGFFPYIYNDDWFFIIANVETQPGIVLGEVRQLESSPWLNLDRVRFEEFGEIVIAGVLREPGGLDSAVLTSEHFWETLIRERNNHLRMLLAESLNTVFESAIRAAIDISRRTQSRECVRFISALREEMYTEPCVEIPNIF